MNTPKTLPNINLALELLNTHYESHRSARRFAELTNHTVPSDTKSWSEILVTLLTGKRGRARRKGSDLDDGSDVKAANVWDAIDTPRFNGCAPAGRVSETSKKPSDVSALDDMPHLFFVLWDIEPVRNVQRCRVWVVRPSHDDVFREMVELWYRKRDLGAIKSNNLQLHPPRNKNSNVIRNACGNLSYPLLFVAELGEHDQYSATHHDPSVLTFGQCQSIDTLPLE